MKFEDLIKKHVVKTNKTILPESRQLDRVLQFAKKKDWRTLSLDELFEIAKEELMLGLQQNPGLAFNYFDALDNLKTLKLHQLNLGKLPWTSKKPAQRTVYDLIRTIQEIEKAIATIRSVGLDWSIVSTNLPIGNSDKLHKITSEADIRAADLYQMYLEYVSGLRDSSGMHPNMSQLMLNDARMSADEIKRYFANKLIELKSQYGDSEDFGRAIVDEVERFATQRARQLFPYSGIVTSTTDYTMTSAEAALGNAQVKDPLAEYECIDGETRTYKCKLGPEITTHRCKNGKWIATKEECPECKDGQTKKEKCFDGSSIVTHKCKDGRWVKTNNKCPKPECEPGEVKTKECEYGDPIVIAKCVKGKWQKVDSKCPECRDGDTKTKDCKYGGPIVVKRCVNGKWVDVDNECPECDEGDEITKDCKYGPPVVVKRCIGGKWVEVNEECPECVEGDTKTKKCWDDSEITTHICQDGHWVATDEKCPEPECQDGEEEKRDCDLGGSIVVRKCVKGRWVYTNEECPECKDGAIEKQDCEYGDPIVVRECINGRWQETGNKCPQPECEEGATQDVQCEDGTSVTVKRCEHGHWVDTGLSCEHPCVDGDTRWVQCIDGEWTVSKCIGGRWQTASEACAKEHCQYACVEGTCMMQTYSLGVQPWWVRICRGPVKTCEEAAALAETIRAEIESGMHCPACFPGDTRTRTCSDGTQIQEQCIDGGWVPVDAACPEDLTPPPEEEPAPEEPVPEEPVDKPEPPEEEPQPPAEEEPEQPPAECVDGEQKTVKCWDGSTIVVSECRNGTWHDTGARCPEKECSDGDVKLITCWDGSQIATEKCIGGRWVSTGETCPEKECEDGDSKTQECWDGSKITTHRCIHGHWVETNEQCPQRECMDGDQQYGSCPDGSMIVTKECINGRWQDTNNQCPQPSAGSDNSLEAFVEGLVDFLNSMGYSSAADKIKNEALLPENTQYTELAFILYQQNPNEGGYIEAAKYLTTVLP